MDSYEVERSTSAKDVCKLIQLKFCSLQFSLDMAQNPYSTVTNSETKRSTLHISPKGNFHSTDLGTDEKLKVV